ncbi:MAG: hypothetical protein WCW27_02755 [Patescibacteria group bacterium]|jgi:hypothetical protein
MSEVNERKTPEQYKAENFQQDLDSYNTELAGRALEKNVSTIVIIKEQSQANKDRGEVLRLQKNGAYLNETEFMADALGLTAAKMRATQEL